MRWASVKKPPDTGKTCEVNCNRWTFAHNAELAEGLRDVDHHDLQGERAFGAMRAHADDEPGNQDTCEG